MGFYNFRVEVSCEMKICRILLLFVICLSFLLISAEAANYNEIYQRFATIEEENKDYNDLRLEVAEAAILLMQTNMLTDLVAIGETDFSSTLRESADEALKAVSNENNEEAFSKSLKFIRNLRSGAALCDGSIISFSDVASDSWYNKAVRYSVAQGMFKGVDEKHFSPNNEMTRGMFITVAGRIYMKADEKNYSDTYKDVSDSAYYSESVKWAKANGILFFIQGELFNPDKPITREEIVTILKGCENYIGNNVQGGQGITFSDAGRVSDWAQSSVAWAMQHGIVSGFEDGTFRPKEYATRAQVAQIFFNQR